MGNVKIITDSTSDLSKELLEKYDIAVVPLNIILEEKSYLDGVEIDPDRIYEWADANSTTPKTAAPLFQYMVDFLRPYKENGDEVIFIGLSEDMSATCQVARLAAEDLEFTNMHVINSMNLSTGIGLQVLRAAEMAEDGVDAATIVKSIEDARLKVRASFVVDNLTYLQRGGRCSAVTALIGNVLALKPEITVVNGKMGVAKKYRGKQSAVIQKYATDLRNALLAADTRRVFITHSGVNQEVIDTIYSFVKGLDHFENVEITRAGGVISSHCGPNTLGVLFYVK